MARSSSGVKWSAWNNPALLLYHGTLDVHAKAILTGINIHAAPAYRRTDFGRGFYTTTNEDQAKTWAWLMWRRTRATFPGAKPAVVVIEASRDSLAQLQDLFFVRGSAAARDYWSFVRHCRRLQPDQARALPSGWYDLVGGPVVMSKWKHRLVYPDYDQLSFHTTQSAALLDQTPKKVLVLLSGQWRKQK
jgi:hypothetical protein